MSFLLVVLAAMTAMNPARVATALPADSSQHKRVAGSAVALLLAVEFVLVAVSGPLLGWIGVTSSSSIIAAGVALVVIGARDSVVAPPVMERPPEWPTSIVIPLFFPTMFTPAIAMIAVAAGANRGVVVGFAALAVGMVASATSSLLVSHGSRLRHGSGLRIAGSIFGLAAVAVGVLVGAHGVMSI